MYDLGCTSDAISLMIIGHEANEAIFNEDISMASRPVSRVRVLNI